MESLRRMSVKKHSALQQIADEIDRLKNWYAESDEKIVAKCDFEIKALHAQGSEIARGLNEKKRDEQRQLTIELSENTITKKAYEERIVQLNKPLLDLATKYETKIEETRLEHNRQRKALENEFTTKLKDLEKKRREIDKEKEETNEPPTTPDPGQSPDPAESH